MKRNPSKPGLILPKIIKRSSISSNNQSYKTIFDSNSYQFDRSTYSKTRSLLYSASRSLNSLDFFLNSIDTISKPRQLSAVISLRRNEKYYLKKFRAVVTAAKFSIYWCKWAFNSYSRRINRFTSFVQISQLYEKNSNKISKTENHIDDIQTKVEMMNFDVNFYKSTRRLESTLDLKAKTILLSNCLNRTKIDVSILKNAFRKMTHMKCVNSLSHSIQEKLFKCCWLEIYESERVIICQNHRAECFYMIISGQLVTTYKDIKDRKSNSISLLERGMTFGELPILDGSLIHNYTISTCKNVELLVITKKDYLNIFLNSNLNNETNIFDSESKLSSTSTNENDNINFLKKLDFLKSWWSSFKDDESKSKSFNFKSIIFPRGKIVTKDTAKSKYIFIVKQGSMSATIKVERKQSNLKEEDESSILADNLNDYELNEYNTHLNGSKYLKKHHTEVNENKLNRKTRKLQKLKTEELNELIHQNKLEERIKINEVTNYLNNIKQVESETSKLIENDEEKERISKMNRAKFIHDRFKFIKNVKFLTDDEKKEEQNINILKKQVQFADQENFISINENEILIKDGHLKLPRIKKNEFNKSIMKNSKKNENLVVEKEEKAVTSERDHKKYNLVSNHAILTSTPILRPSLPINEFIDLEELNSELNEKKSSLFSMTKTNNELIETTDKNDQENNFTSTTKYNNNNNNNNMNTSIQTTNSSFSSKATYLLIRNLYKGEHVGLADILYDNQPSMQLISNGCECILLPKDQFIQNVTVNYLVELRKMQGPIPKLDLIKNDYKVYLNWKDYTNKQLIKSINKSKKNKKKKI
jgi:hypothetical protein